MTDQSVQVHQQQTTETPDLASSRRASYRRVITEMQHELSPASRLYSRLIHNRFVEALSEVIGVTIARPRPLLFGSIAILVGTAGSYALASYVGYALSGLEPIISFVVGWVFGVLYECIRVMITGNRSS